MTCFLAVMCDYAVRKFSNFVYFLISAYFICSSKLPELSKATFGTSGNLVEQIKYAEVKKPLLTETRSASNAWNRIIYKGSTANFLTFDLGLWLSLCNLLDNIYTQWILFSCGNVQRSGDETFKLYFLTAYFICSSKLPDWMITLLCSIQTAHRTAPHCAATSCAALSGAAQRCSACSSARHCVALLAICLCKLYVN